MVGTLLSERCHWVKDALSRAFSSVLCSSARQGILTALIAVLPLQFIAYELAIAKGINPDTPRNLAKAVTTD